MSLTTLENEVFRAERSRRIYTGISVLIAVAVLAAGFDLSNSLNSGSFLEGLSQFIDYPGEIVIEAIDSGAEFPSLLLEFLPALFETLNIALVATLFGGVAALILACLSTRMLDVPGWVVTLTRRSMDIMRAFPELVIALFLIFVLGSSPVPAMIAVAFHTAGALGKLFSEVIENIDQKPVEGLRACGASWLQRIRYGVLPQVAPNFLSYFLMRFEINVRASAILGFVGAGGIGSELRRTIGWGKGAGDETAAIFVLLFAAIVAIDQVSSYYRQKLTGRSASGAEDRGSALPAEGRLDAAWSQLRRRSVMTIGVIAAVLAYFTYAHFAFGVPDLLERARPERAVLLARDAVAYKIHATKDLRDEELVVAVEGERIATFETPPDWIEMEGPGDARIDLGAGYSVEIRGTTSYFEAPDYGTVEVRIEGGEVVTILPDGAEALPGMRISPRRFDWSPSLARRLQVSTRKIEVHNYFAGWENFWFAFRSPFHGMGIGDLWSVATAEERLDETRSNARYLLDEFLENEEWHHGEVFVAVVETLLMAVLGTMVAALVGLPLAFLAAGNFTPNIVARFAVRRFFDFVRGIDNLIWSLIFIRAFGLGPLTGALAIAVTDTGTLGKLFSEALENIDDRQVEGVRATGASQIQRYRYGVIPQILPVFISQTLYYLESNTRSATIIGALGAGGIGLLLVQAIQTQRDWENVAYMIVLIILLVFAMDNLSSWLRRRLIHGKTA